MRISRTPGRRNGPGLRFGAVQTTCSASTGPTKTMLRTEYPAKTRKPAVTSRVVARRGRGEFTHIQAAKTVASPRYRIANGSSKADCHSVLASEIA